MRYIVLITFLLGYFNSFSQVTAAISGFTNVSCNGGGDGTATVIGAGGTPYTVGSPYLYSWNTAPVQNTQTATGLGVGIYVVTVYDSLGASGVDTVTIGEPSAVTVGITFSTDVSCFGFCDGSAMASGSGGVGGFTYMWNTAPVQIGATAVGLCAGNYQVTATDSNGCMAVNNVSILEPPLVSILVNTTDDTCGLCVGTADAIVMGGTAPYTYLWSPGGSTQVATGLCQGVYAVTITDANGCSSFANATINVAGGPSCGFGVLTGTVYKDDNTDCIQDSLEMGLANVMIQAMPGPYYANTDVNGDYSMVIPYGNYTVTQVALPYYNEICPVAGSYSVVLDTINNTINNNDFGDTITPAQEVSVILTSGVPRPGFAFNYYMSYTSISNTFMNGDVYLVVDDTLTFISSSPAPDVISGDTLFWNYTNLQQFETRNIYTTFMVPNQVSLLGDSITACAQISPLVGDVNVSNNTSCVTDAIVGSYDPNDKQVVPEGIGPTGDIFLTDNELSYTIRFQNSGTFLATNVVVVDVLSPNLDISSLKNVVASHPFTYAVDAQGVLTFTFNNIMLPDSGTDEPGSHGLIQFTIDQNSSNVIGTVINNTADIYFDFNPAIVTNTVTNTIVTITDIGENENLLNSVNVYPNPSNGQFTVIYDLDQPADINVRIVDILGNVIQENSMQKLPAGAHKKEWDMSNINAGIYFMSIKIGNESFLKKIVIQ